MNDTKIVMRKVNPGEPPIELLPRRDIGEAAFRRYEPIIAAACKGSIEVQPFDGQSAYTFVTRFKDALLGYRRYKYFSSLIPKGLEVRLLKPVILANGWIRIECPFVVDTYDTTDDPWHAPGESAHFGVELVVQFCEDHKDLMTRDSLYRSIHYSGESEKALAVELLSKGNFFFEVDTQKSVIKVKG